MRLRKVFGALVVLGALGGCSKIPGSCEQDSDCGLNQFCHSQENQCFDSRYTGLSIEIPVEHTVVGAGPVTVRAHLEVNPVARPVYPSQLSFTAKRVSDGTTTELTQQSAENGTYTAVWTPPTEEGEYILQATSPEAAGLSASVQVTVDRTAPSLVVQVPGAQSTVPADGFSYTDPKATTPAWRRDQTVTVRVESDSKDLDPASVHVVVRGYKGGTDVTDLALTPVTPCTKTYCGTVEVPLWRPGLPDFRGNFLIEVTANDVVGNVRQSSTPIPVTRWKWAFDGASGAIRVTPAIGDKGTIYFGTSDANGKVFALEPNGTKKWEKQLGSVLGSPTVGKNPDGTDRLYVAPGSGTLATVYALDANGTTLAICPVPGAQAGIVTSALAITHQYLKSQNATFETAISSHNPDDGAFLFFRPDLPSTSPIQCTGRGNPFTEPQGASIVIQGNDYFFSAPRSTNPTAWNYRFNPELETFELPQTYDYLSMGAPLTGMGLAEGGTLVAAGGLRSSTGTVRGGILAMYQVPSTGSSYKWQFPSDPTGSEPVRNMVIGAGNVVIFGRDLPEGAAELTAINLMAPSDEAAVRATAPNAGSFPGAPVLGASSTLYAASFTGPEAGLGEVSAWSASDLKLRWKLSDSVGPAEASPSLDCTRATDGTPASASHGVLYVPSLDGRLYAFVVDSPGLDTSAPWPKYQHDARNTGNPETPITNCR
ncbi:PQQ-binding-like beta-propeller repeat protein [Vitiosangium sp. GDMCC 1.1324]|uniref:PQQ-binding-like beta-propeller repeat protein n=1 Tax=Vitiosangium sp. (strain GDMCC 1.1324) TaxID=2138576 RepID=UPI000D38E9E9|nr:PQQ-binding-like beta-propeller repeat protein [Vitiosangium sp. GDMCC 1.1324]PTL83675.1 hypothetical protein DAT35_09335 [Vitiosangium sp. GDMCC 1.1324]